MQIPKLLACSLFLAKSSILGRASDAGVNFGLVEMVRAFFSCINKYGETFIAILDLGNIALCHVIPCLFQMLVTGD